MDVAPDEPQHEEPEQGSQDRPFDYHAFLRRKRGLVLAPWGVEEAMGVYLCVPEPFVAETFDCPVDVLDAISL